MWAPKRTENNKTRCLESESQQSGISFQALTIGLILEIVNSYWISVNGYLKGLNHTYYVAVQQGDFYPLCANSLKFSFAETTAEIRSAKI